jgi:hypothetical protein
MKIKSSISASVVAAYLVCATAVSAAIEVGGIKVEEKMKVANTDLVLNGSGVRHALGGIVKVYVASLYVTQKKTTSADVAALKGPKRMHLNLLREVNSNDFSKGMMSGVRANLSQADQQKHFDSLLRMGTIFGTIPALKKGETISVDLLPGTGTVVLVNGKRVGEPFPDESFFDAFTQIWLGAKPIDTGLKPALLGSAPAEKTTNDRF